MAESENERAANENLYHRPSTFTILEFSFNYSLNDCGDCILDTEKQLRNLIDKVLTDKIGLNWETDSKAGFTVDERKDLEKIHKDEQSKNPTKELPSRLLDYSYIGHLGTILRRNWNHFGVIFPSRNKTDFMLEKLAVLRNPMMHGRDTMLSHEYHLCLGLCGELQKIVYDWKLGYAAKIKSYQFDVAFEVPANNSDPSISQHQAMLEAEHWTGRLQTILSAKVEERINDRGAIEKVFRASGGHIRIEFPKAAGLQNYVRKGQFHQANLRLKTENAELVDKVLIEGDHPCWVVEMTLSDSLDVSTIAENARIAGTRINGGSGTSKDRIHHFSHTFFDENDISISATVSDGGGKISQISLVIWRGKPNFGFYRAHRLFLPETIMSILYDRKKAPEIRALVEEACTKPSSS